ncbi:plasmid maintenance system antidote protein, xre family [Candidatus Magnetomorum sp. HK-1]|nr:plasmid maintenance system antidote protein, xre family [Candidatus Magnetomorum sp. HK-1]
MADNKINTYTPDYLVTPGEVLEDYLESYRMTQAEFSERTGLSKKTINRIIKGKSPITPKTALKFERTLGRPAHFWNKLESDYQQDLELLADKELLEKSKDWLKEFPLKEMLKYNWIKKVNVTDKLTRVKEMCSFFGIASPGQWSSIQNMYAVAYRKASPKKYSSGALSAWLRKGELEAQKIKCKPFNKKKFKEVLAIIRSLTMKKDTEFVQNLIELCAESGVAVVIVPMLPKTGVYGATRWIRENPIIQLSLRYKTNDQFWFTFFHEAAHIIKHGRKKIFVETGLSEDKDEKEKEKEKEADHFSKDLLIPNVYFKEFISQNKQFAKKSIVNFANKIKIAPGIVVGRLQHDELIHFNRYNELKIRYEWTNFIIQ